MASLTPAVQTRATWNTSHLTTRLSGDLVSATAAGGLVAPLITMIDKGIIENASNRASLSSSMISSLKQLLLRPHHFLISRPFRLIFALYSGTYLSANTLDTFSSTVLHPVNGPAHTTSGTSKFLTTSAANLSLCLYKDSQFTRLFGNPAAAAAGPVPKITYALFAARDSLTVFASFCVPAALGPRLPATLLGAEWERYASRASVAQFVAPAAVQLLSTPLHLLGLDLYNRPGASAASRVSQVWRDYGKSTLARVSRIVPAFGFGGVVNNTVRRRWMESLEA